MAINQALDRTAMTAAQAQLARVESQGCLDHPHRRSLLEASGPATNRDLSDAVHLFCQLYGRYPGLIEIALNNCPAGPVRDWMREASDAYERERFGGRTPSPEETRSAERAIERLAALRPRRRLRLTTAPGRS